MSEKTSTGKIFFVIVYLASLIGGLAFTLIYTLSIVELNSVETSLLVVGSLILAGAIGLITIYTELGE